MENSKLQDECLHYVVKQGELKQTASAKFENLVLQIDKFYTGLKIVYELMFRTVVLRRSECLRDK